MVDLLGQRKGQMLDMGAAVGEGTTQRVKYRIPTRGLLVKFLYNFPADLVNIYRAGLYLDMLPHSSFCCCWHVQQERVMACTAADLPLVLLSRASGMPS